MGDQKGEDKSGTGNQGEIKGRIVGIGAVLAGDKTKRGYQGVDWAILIVRWWEKVDCWIVWRKKEEERARGRGMEDGVGMGCQAESGKEWLGNDGW